MKNNSKKTKEYNFLSMQLSHDSVANNMRIHEIILVKKKNLTENLHLMKIKKFIDVIKKEVRNLAQKKKKNLNLNITILITARYFCISAKCDFLFVSLIFNIVRTIYYRFFLSWVIVFFHHLLSF